MFPMSIPQIYKVIQHMSNGLVCQFSCVLLINGLVVKCRRTPCYFHTVSSFHWKGGG